MAASLIKQGKLTLITRFGERDEVCIITDTADSIIYNIGQLLLYGSFLTLTFPYCDFSEYACGFADDTP